MLTTARRVIAQVTSRCTEHGSDQNAAVDKMGGNVARGWVHTVHRNGSWVNEIEGQAVISTHTTKEAAVDAGRVEARRRRTEHVIHNMDGTVSERNSYGSDPHPPRG